MIWRLLRHPSSLAVKPRRHPLSAPRHIGGPGTKGAGRPLPLFPRTERLASGACRVVLLMSAILVAALVVDGGGRAHAATYETGAYAIISPLSQTKYVTSPARYHDGCEPYTSTYWDSPNFDNISVCHPAASGDWAMDIAADQGAAVYVDVNPQAIDGGCRRRAVPHCRWRRRPVGPQRERQLPDIWDPYLEPQHVELGELRLDSPRPSEQLPVHVWNRDCRSHDRP